MMLMSYILVFYYVLPALANTEIVNFIASETHWVDLPSNNHWTVLNQSYNEDRWEIPPAPVGTPLESACDGEDWAATGASADASQSPCPHEIWLALDLTQGGWDAYAKFTLRVSWPAFFPSDISIQIYDPETLAARFGASDSTSATSVAAKTRRKYARIRVVDAGILTPTPASNTHPPNGDPVEPLPVPLIVILEPLYYGVLPASVAPVLCFLVLVVVVAGMAVPKINEALQGVASRARQDMLVADASVKED